MLLDNKAVHACLTMVGQLQGRSLTTIEGLEKNGELDRLQQDLYPKWSDTVRLLLAGYDPVGKGAFDGKSESKR